MMMHVTLVQKHRHANNNLYRSQQKLSGYEVTAMHCIKCQSAPHINSSKSLVIVRFFLHWEHIRCLARVRLKCAVTFFAFKCHAQNFLTHLHAYTEHNRGDRTSVLRAT